ncbi:MAG TPA: hypothetical protein VFD43_12130 [Planctomycetota bacterium]|nr:hypothetical protein [Planctomycetota bacterium]
MGAAFDEFNRQLDDFFREQLPARVLQFQHNVAGDAIDKVLKRSPVLDGMLRFNWQATVGSPSATPRAGEDRSRDGQATADEAKAALRADLQPYGNAFLSNPLPYAEVIEEGLYPPNPVRGTRIRSATRRGRRRSLANKGLLPADQEADYEIRSAGGFSKQAPVGMVGVTALELMDYFERD